LLRLTMALLQVIHRGRGVSERFNRAVGKG
jgi:hypothetical protein